MGRGILDQSLALPEIGTHGSRARLGTEASPQQPIAVKALQPGGIADVGFAAGYVLGVTSIHQDDAEAVLLQHFIGRNPVNTGGFHRHAGNAACLEPASHLMQVAGERAKCPHGIIVHLRIDGRHVHGRADIDGDGARVDH